MIKEPWVVSQANGKNRLFLTDEDGMKGGSG